MRLGRPEGDAPGRKTRNNAGGSTRVYWMASKEAVAVGFTPDSVRLHGDDEAIAARCRVLQAEMLQWLAEKAGIKTPRLDPTVNDLIRAYRTRDESAYHGVKWNTRRTYDKVLDTMERGFGGTALRAIKLGDIKRWYETTRFPDGRGAGRVDHARTGQGLVAMLRRVILFGASIEMKDCARIAVILQSTKWQGAKKRTIALELEHVVAFCAKAREMGRPSLALGTAIQWETMLRQRDVIGEWEPFDARGPVPAGTTINGRVWVNGLLWSDISPEWLLRKTTTKTGTPMSFDLTLLPLALDELQRVPEAKRDGPVIVDEAPGRPYAENRYQQEWRKVADAAGISRGVFNMDARSGGATEADVAGAARSDLQRGMGHSDPKTTTRYVRGDSLPAARRVAEMRAAHRARSGPK